MFDLFSRTIFIAVNNMVSKRPALLNSGTMKSYILKMDYTNFWSPNIYWKLEIFDWVGVFGYYPARISLLNLFIIWLK